MHSTLLEKTTSGKFWAPINSAGPVCIAHPAHSIATALRFVLFACVDLSDIVDWNFHNSCLLRKLRLMQRRRLLSATFVRHCIRDFLLDVSPYQLSVYWQVKTTVHYSIQSKNCDQLTTGRNWSSWSATWSIGIWFVRVFDQTDQWTTV